MEVTLSQETEDWLKAQVELGYFPSVEAAINYAVKLASLRSTLLESLADPRRYSVDEVRSHLGEHFAKRRASRSAT